MGFVAASSAQKNWNEDLWTDPFSCLFYHGLLGNVLSQQLKIPNQGSQARQGGMSQLPLLLLPP